MFCNKCGEILRDNALRCPVCGAAQKKQSTQINTACNCETNTNVSFDLDRPKTHSSGGSWEGRTFQYQPAQSASSHSYHRSKSGIKELAQLAMTFFKRALDFGGRSSRREYWLTRLLVILSGIVAGMLTDAFPILTFAWLLLIPVPYVALHSRRLHDIGKSGWWQLIRAVPVAGELILDIWLCLPSVPSNRFGAKPYM